MTAFFTSRWVDVPDGVTEVPEGGLPKGFRAAGVACGIKEEGVVDLGLLVSDAPDTTSAARFTASAVLAAPVLVCKNRVRLDAIRAVVANSGNANAATGGRGLDEAAKMQGGAAMIAGVPEDQVAVASTGVIGVQLDGRKILQGTLAAGKELAADGDGAFQQAIMTTDAFEKRATLDVALSGGSVRLSAQCKGAGMISPRHATMLCFVQTDAKLAAQTADLLLGITVKRSFDRVSVDGQLSTNDTVILQCSGASGVEVAPESPDEATFGQALDALLSQLALLMIKDGEGARRIGRVLVRGGNPVATETTARVIANSPLVKTALYGGDPNWGRVAQAIGLALVGSEPVPFDISIEGIQVASAGAAVRHDEDDLKARVQGDEVDYAVGLPGDGYEHEVFFSDLGHGYITINADYTT